MMGAVIILALLCVCLLSYMLRVVKQVREINEALEDVRRGNLDRRIVVHRNTLLADTCFQINEIVMKTKEQRILSERSAVRNDKLMTCLSHDIRTPLTSITGCLDAIHYRLIHGENSRISVETAREKAYVLKQYIDELFQWFKLHSRDEKANLKTLEIVEELRTIFAGWIEALESRHISYDFATEQEEIYVTADKLFLERIINNLMKNAWEHSGAAKIWIEVSAAESCVQIKVGDDGKGISAEAIPHVFELLYQEESFGNCVGGGLGLAIAKELVLLQNGKISVQSEKNHGTAFCVELPKASSPGRESNEY